MGDSVVVVNRLRHQLKKSARIEYAARERDRLRAESDLARTEQDLREARTTGSQELVYMNQRFTWLDRMEEHRRAQEQSLVQRSQAVEQQRQVLSRASQEARATELVLEKSQAEQDIENRRREALALDALAITRWRNR